MKKLAFLCALSLGAVILFGAAMIKQTEPACDSKALKEKTKKLLDPFKYDQGKVTKILYKKKAQVKEVEVPLMLGEKYRVAFNIEDLPVPIVINIYNKDKESKNRKLLFSSKDQSGKEFSWEPEKRATKMYINYEIPAVDAEQQGCVGFMLGFKS